MEALAELVVGLLLTWGTFSTKPSWVGVRLLRAGIAIIFSLAAVQSFGSWRHPETERALSDSARHVIDALRVTARTIAVIALFTGGTLRCLAADPPAHDLASDLLIMFAVLMFVDCHLLRQIARQ